MSAAPEISVVMGVYNGGETLAPTIDSILGQQDADFEFIIVDDGSTDGSGRIADEYAARDPRLRVIHQANGGLTRALIAGCAAARGRYIARQDSGDLSAPHRLSAQARVLDGDNSVLFVSCWTRYAGPRLEPMYTFRGTGRAARPVRIIDLDARYCHIDEPAHHGSVMFRRDAYERAGGYRSAFRYAQDWDLWYRLAELGNFQMIEEVLYTARISPDSITSRARKTQQELAALMVEMIRTRARGESDSALLGKAAEISARKHLSICSHARGLYFIGEALRRKGDRRCCSYLFRAGTRCPFLIKSWLRLLQSMAITTSDANPSDV